jgi:hypothetical protein
MTSELTPTEYLSISMMINHLNEVSPAVVKLYDGIEIQKKINGKLSIPIPLLG